MRARFYLAAAVAMAASCGQSGDTDGDSDGDGGAPTAEAPVQEATPYEIEALDARRFIVDAEALIQLGIDRSAKRIAAARNQRGYLITRLSGDSLAADLGLKQGDLIRGVNNVEMTGPAQLQRAWNRARRAKKVSLLLERDGAVLEIDWLFSSGVTDQLEAVRPPIADRDRSAAEYAGVVELARTGLVEKELHRYELDRAVLAALETHPSLGDRRNAGTWTARGGHRGVTVGDHSIYAAIGIGRYDIVKAVGASDVRGTRDLRARLAELASSSDMSISVVRVDEPVILRYRLVDGRIDKSAWKAALEAFGERVEPYGSVRSLAGRSRPGPIDGIKQIDDETFEVEKKAADELARGAFIRGARVVPAIKNGKPDGFKLYGIRPSSPVAQLGLKNGDRIAAINGLDVTTPDKVLAAVKRIKKARVVAVEVDRRGKNKTLTYKIKR